MCFVVGIDSHQIDAALKRPSDIRLFVISAALDRNYTVDRIHDLTKIDKWFLYKLETIAHLKLTLPKITLGTITPAAILVLKSNGFSDRQIASGLGATVSEEQVRAKRLG